LQELHTHDDQLLEIGIDSLRDSLDEVGEAGEDVGGDSGDVLDGESLHELGEDDVQVVLLELGLHVVSNLSDGVADSVSDHRVGIVEHSHNHFHDGIDLRDLVDVLSNLRKGHDS